ncbi:MAG: RluA family pseudouridine synthase [Christensenellales bacterium]|jgi:23S rRNA pseudouridine1911/1915/1917 synthase
MKFEDINIIYEDNHLLVVVKPQNMPVCPDSSRDQNLLDLLKEYIKVTENKSGEAFLGLVHRLDRPTGGVMVFAKTSKAASRLFESIKEQVFEKYYLAIVKGVPKQPKGIIKDALYKDINKNQVYCVPIATEGAKLAILEYEIIDKVDELSLLKINLITGRSHQARVQLKNMGTPIFADAKYGEAQIGANLALWAYSLKFPHPVTKEIMYFIVYPPINEVPWHIFDLNMHLAVI